MLQILKLNHSNQLILFFPFPLLLFGGLHYCEDGMSFPCVFLYLYFILLNELPGINNKDLFKSLKVCKLGTQLGKIPKVFQRRKKS